MCSRLCVGSVHDGIPYYVTCSSIGYPDFVELRMRLSVAPVNMSALSQPEKWPESATFRPHSVQTIGVILLILVARG